MSDHSNIQWTDATWPVVTGCERKSPGCANCYAVNDSWRLSHNPNAKVAAAYAGTVERNGNGQLDWTGRVNCLEERLDWPLHWRTPRRIFVCNESDLFYGDDSDRRRAEAKGRALTPVPFEFIDRVFGVMHQTPQHEYQILTKRDERMLAYVMAMAALDPKARARRVLASMYANHPARRLVLDNADDAHIGGFDWPLPNVRLGVSIEDKPRAARFDAVCELGEQGWNTMVSMEPLLDDVEIPARYLALGRRAWAIPGGESSSKARPCALEWIERRVEQCRPAGVAIFVKQLGAFIVSEQRTCDQAMVDLLKPEVARRMVKTPDGSEFWAWRAKLRDKKGGDPSEWDQRLNVREFPEARS